MLRFLRIILILAVILGVAVLAFAFLGDLSPEQQEVREPVSLGDGS